MDWRAIVLATLSLSGLLLVSCVADDEPATAGAVDGATGEDAASRDATTTDSSTEDGGRAGEDATTVDATVPDADADLTDADLTDATGDATLGDGSTDSGLDGGFDAADASDATTTDAHDAAVCDGGTPLASYVAPDAGFGGAGGSIPACLACGHAKCEAALGTCDDSCACRIGLEGYFDCLGTGASPITCVTANPILSEPSFVPFKDCASSLCATECGSTPTDAGPVDGGTD